MNAPCLRTVALALLTPGLLLAGGCASPPSQQRLDEVRRAANPTDRTQRTITTFTPALRCMDDMLFANGTRDVTLMMEDLRDATTKVPVSVRDMMVSAVSDMTRRSRAVRLSVFGADQQNIGQVLQQAQKTSPFAVVPEHVVRGSISQFDEDVQRRSASVGASRTVLEKLFGLRLLNESKFSELGMDMAVARTDSMTLLPGVSSKNTTVIVRQDFSAGDGQGVILGSVINFTFAVARAEGVARATRNMVELGTIELVGKLTRTPYWQCLGIADRDPEVQREVDDWFHSLDPAERLSFYRERLRERRYYDGPLDGPADAAFSQALAGYRRAMGPQELGTLPRATGATDTVNDADFFRRFITRQDVPPGPLATPRSKLALALEAARASSSAASTPAPAESGTATTPVTAASAPTPVTAATLPAPDPAPAHTPISVRLQPDPRTPGSLRLSVTTDQPGYVYCYARDPKADKIRRVFPNRFARDPRIATGQAVTLPGAAQFRLSADMEYACLHAPREVYNDLMPPLRWGDFEDIRLPSFTAIRDHFNQASGLPIALAPAIARP
jgi:hypothetical protein